jgi:hypothetical protein
VSRDELPDPAREVVEDLRRVEPPDGLMESVMAEVERTPQERGLRLSWLPVASAVAVSIAVVVLAVLAVGRIREAGSSPSPTTTASTTPVQATPAPIGDLPVSGIVEGRTPLPEGAYPASADATFVWLGSESSGEVLAVEALTGEIAGRVQVNAPTTEPYNLWPISDGTSVWTAGRDDRSLVRIDIGSMATAVRWPIDAIPYRIAPAGSSIWVTDFDGGRVLEVSAESGEVLTTIGLARATGIAVTPEAVWVASYIGQLARIDPASKLVTATYPIASDATDVYAVDDQLWIVGIKGRRLERFDTARGVVAAWTESVSAVSFVDGGPWAAVPGGVVALKPVTLERTGAVPLPDVAMDQMVAAGGRLWAWGAASDGTFLYRIRPGS